VSRVSLSACAKASSLASEKSVGWRKRQLTGGAPMFPA
jgi:hypothetical protein